jgi:hypothetical protein
MDQRIKFPNEQQKQPSENFDHLINVQFKEKENFIKLNNNSSDAQNLNRSIKVDKHNQLEIVQSIDNSDTEIQSPFLDINKQIKSDFGN